ncbi:MAG: hypothetical protein EP333_00215 [Bacteroidetes bacterium]|nr:MAG: hypothetical protein EP333_00215 [Bacteroidota bacterium]
MKSKQLLLLSLTLLIAFSCKKKNPEPEQPQSEEPPVPTLDVVVRPESKVIDTTNIALLSDSAQIQAGTIIYQFSGTPDVYNTGDVIVESRGEGFIRKVLSSQVVGNTITYDTEQAKLTDVFEQGSGSYQSELKDAWVYSFNNVNVYNSPSLDVTLDAGSINLNPNIQLSFNIENGAVTYLNCEMANAPFSATVTATATANGAANLLDFEKKIATIKKTGIFMMGFVPVVVVYETDLIATANLNASSQTSGTISASYQSNIDAGVTYNNVSGWSGSFNNTNGQLNYNFDASSTVTYNFTVDITPRVSVKLYGVVGPELSSKAYLNYDANIDIESNKDETLTTGLNFTAAVDVNVFDYFMANYSQTYDLMGPYVVTRPAAITMISGNNQTVDQGSITPVPLVVKVVDSENDPVPGAYVRWEVLNGDGSLSLASTTTNSTGESSNDYTMGSNASHTIRATIKNGSGQTIGSPIDFNLNLGTAAPVFEFVSTYGFSFPDCVLPDSAYIYMAVAGGTPPYNFSIDGGTTWYPSTNGSDMFNYGPPFYGMPACGTYNCKVIDNVGGSVHDTITTTIVVQP